jgi:hypothetical protein
VGAARPLSQESYRPIAAPRAFPLYRRFITRDRDSRANRFRQLAHPLLNS